MNKYIPTKLTIIKYADDVHDLHIEQGTKNNGSLTIIPIDKDSALILLYSGAELDDRSNNKGKDNEQ